MRIEEVKNIILNPVSMFLIGLLTGFLVKEIDIHFYAQHFGISLSNIFSEAGIWIVIGVSISLFSRNRKYAMLNVFTYCIGMIIMYYLTAELTGSVYAWTYIRAWVAFSCLSPVMAYFVTLAKEHGIVSLIIKTGIFAGYIIINMFLGGFIKSYDIVFFIILIYLLFIKKFKKQ